MQVNNRAFRSFLEQYQNASSRKLTVLSVFRLPLERHISSFFQWYAEGVVREGFVSRPEDTIIARYPVDQLQLVFIELIAGRSLVGRKESIHELCGELDYPITALQFDAGRGFAIVEDELMRLVLFRFDLLFPYFLDYLQEALVTKLSASTSNATGGKWYAGKFEEFKTTLLLQPDLIRMVHEDKQDLIDVFYPFQYQDIVNDRIARYGLYTA